MCFLLRAEAIIIIKQEISFYLGYHKGPGNERTRPTTI